MTKNFIDMTGLTFGALSVVSRAENAKGGTARWNCRCSCGELRVIEGTGLRAGRHKSCGCLSPRFSSDRVTTHGMSRSRTYRIWHGMHGRCSDKSTGKERRNYYAKGIRVCERWAEFERFLDDMGEAPDGMSIDRIDGRKGYEPGNCRWATSIEQGNNTAANVRLAFGGEDMTISQWARRVGLKINTLVYRVRRGWTVERALTQPAQARTFR